MIRFIHRCICWKVSKLEICEWVGRSNAVRIIRIQSLPSKMSKVAPDEGTYGPRNPEKDQRKYDVAYHHDVSSRNPVPRLVCDDIYHLDDYKLWSAQCMDERNDCAFHLLWGERGGSKSLFCFYDFLFSLDFTVFSDFFFSDLIEESAYDAFC